MGEEEDSGVFLCFAFDWFPAYYGEREKSNKEETTGMPFQRAHVPRLIRNQRMAMAF